MKKLCLIATLLFFVAPVQGMLRSMTKFSASRTSKVLLPVLQQQKRREHGHQGCMSCAHGIKKGSPYDPLLQTLQKEWQELQHFKKDYPGMFDHTKQANEKIWNFI